MSDSSKPRRPAGGRGGTSGNSSREAHAARKRGRRLLEQFAQADSGWIAPLARRIHEESEPLGRYLAEVLARIAVLPLGAHASHARSRWELSKGIARLLFPGVEGVLGQVERSVQSIELALGDLSQEILRDQDVTCEILSPTIEFLAAAIEKNPRLVMLLGSPELLSETFGEMGSRLSGLVAFLPALSRRAAEDIPELKETLFAALLALRAEDRAKLYALADDVLREVYRSHILPRLAETLGTDPRGKVLTPILAGAIKAVPGESCLNAVIAIACTPQRKLSSGRAMAIAVQELGGLYVKISQVLAELCPPSLARELRTTQDDAGGLYPSVEKSWQHLLSVLARPELAPFKELLVLPATPVRHFASASVGALYELTLTSAGKTRFGSDTVLVKLQRPGLEALLGSQCAHLLTLCDEARVAVEADIAIGKETRAELLGIAAAVRRSVLNYHRQSHSELDFGHEERNAAKVREALRDDLSIRVPTYHFSLPDVVIMERMPGTKVTKIVETKYLERKEIADTIVHAYLELVFVHGVVWADPHPGNILFDDVSNRAAMIDLNPCFVWEKKTREHFKHLLYRLLLRDATGVYEVLYELVESPESLHSNTIFDELRRFLNSTFESTSLTRFVGEFIRLLAEHDVDLRVEVQAALRGLSQVAITAGAISARNGFSLLLRRYFGSREMLLAAWQVGFMRVLRVLMRLAFDLTRSQPEEDVGPVLDERDLQALQGRVRELARADVCDIRIERVSPEDHPALRMSVDGSSLLVTSELRIEILEQRRPAAVRYVLLLPSQAWLRERQEFVKLTSVARNLCLVDCLEQLRRNSLDDYWHTVVAWNKDPGMRRLKETWLVRSVRTAGRKLLALRFANIWDSPMTGIPRSQARVWRFLLRMEHRREESEFKRVDSAQREFAKAPLNSITFGTFHRLRLVALEALLWHLRRRVKSQKYAMHLLPMSTRAFEDLVLFNLARNVQGESGFTAQAKRTRSTSRNPRGDGH